MGDELAEAERCTSRGCGHGPRDHVDNLGCRICACSEYWPHGPTPPLSEAEVIARAVAPLNPWAGVVMAELDRVRGELLTEKRAHLRTIEDSQRIRSEFERRGRVEQAATALVEFWRDQVPLEYCHSPEQDRLTDALIEVVKGETL